MRPRALRAALLAAAALGLLPLAAVPAAALPGAQGAPRADLTLTVHQGRTAGGPVLTSARLTCAPDAGTHPRPAAACHRLTRAGGDFARLEARRAPCPMIHRPVTAVARGTWHGRATRFVRTYPNSCVAAVRTGDVFRLAPRG